MRFTIHRTSEYRTEVQPCKGAYQVDSFQVDERTVKDPSKIPDGKDWYSKGINHRVVKGHIFRDFPVKVWVVDIESLEELLEFTKEHGEIVLSGSSWRSREFAALEIYDDYRE